VRKHVGSASTAQRKFATVLVFFHLERSKLEKAPPKHEQPHDSV
jgi:hypothetical protein